VSTPPEERRAALLECKEIVDAALTGLIGAVEHMARTTMIANHVFELGQAAGYLRNARALMEVAANAIRSVLDDQSRPITGSPQN
jgi:hypothetical protein